MAGPPFDNNDKKWEHISEAIQFTAAVVCLTICFLSCSGCIQKGWEAPRQPAPEVRKGD